MKTLTEIPRYIATPPGELSQLTPGATLAYEAIYAADQTLLPARAVEIAVTAAGFKNMNVARASKKADVWQTWREDLNEAVRCGSRTLPSLAPVEAALAHEQATAGVRYVFRSTWNAALRGLPSALADGGDDIVTGLAAIWAEHWPAFLAEHAKIIHYETDSALLNGASPDESAAFRAAGEHLACCVRAQAARQQLDVGTPYKVQGAGMGILWKATNVRLKTVKVTGIEYFHLVAATWPPREPWLPTRGQLLAHVEEHRRDLANMQTERTPPRRTAVS